ncbi:unnamed protein product [Notodromas monacha]|uniref:CN hydrolase domain-containing protein n=1 Tax=Notodromas monacha TaxID=399045 RepID=A0A7R9GLT1_9CRUS|nr:unnamed protein product [Notodromas monacha]CAG0925992.1 unnamed protein product [Notodromas monacha]
MKVSLSYIQNNPLFGEKQRNFDQVWDLAQTIKTDVLVLPELFATGYAFTSRNEALEAGETTDGSTVEFLKTLSHLTGAIVVAGWVERDGDAVYNGAIMVDDHGVVAVYRKIHLFNRETLWFDAGNLPFSVHEVQGIKLGMMVCFDWYFPESMRTLALLGADVVAHPSNLVLPHCQTAMRTRCLENRVYAITANRMGSDHNQGEHFAFTGQSQITDVYGVPMAQSPMDETDVQTVVADLGLARNKMLNPHNDLLGSRQTQFYGL